jgi:hypothetical protein
MYCGMPKLYRGKSIVHIPSVWWGAMRQSFMYLSTR